MLVGVLTKPEVQECVSCVFVPAVQNAAVSADVAE